MILRKDARVNNLNSYRYKGFAKPLILSQKGSESRQIGLKKIIGKDKMEYSTYGKSWQILKLVQMANIAAYIYIYKYIYIYIYIYQKPFVMLQQFLVKLAGRISVYTEAV
jgi:hypothetical protein